MTHQIKDRLAVPEGGRKATPTRQWYAWGGKWSAAEVEGEGPMAWLPRTEVPRGSQRRTRRISYDALPGFVTLSGIMTATREACDTGRTHRRSTPVAKGGMCLERIVHGKWLPTGRKPAGGGGNPYGGNPPSRGAVCEQHLYGSVRAGVERSPLATRPVGRGGVRLYSRLFTSSCLRLSRCA